MGLCGKNWNTMLSWNCNDKKERKKDEEEGKKERRKEIKIKKSLLSKKILLK